GEVYFPGIEKNNLPNSIPPTFSAIGFVEVPEAIWFTLLRAPPGVSADNSPERWRAQKLDEISTKINSIYYRMMMDRYFSLLKENDALNSDQFRRNLYEIWRYDPKNVRDLEDIYGD
ncbi:MAG: hypothetical protein QXU27_00140, partial [Candidatus Anstonellales archaeon]